MSADATRTHKAQARREAEERQRWVTQLLRTIRDEVEAGEIDENAKLHPGTAGTA